jgi:predicted transcriptional regulator
MAFIRTIPIEQIARSLELFIGPNGHIRCWYPEKHKNADRTPSVGIDKRRNKVKCFACNGRPLGPLDLVMDVNRVQAADAALWIAGRFPVPRLKLGAHLKGRESDRIQYGTEQPIELLIRSGIWATLSQQTQRLIPVVLVYATKRSGQDVYDLELSYAAMRRYSGISSLSSVSQALNEMREIGWMPPKARGSVNAGPGQPCARYVLTPFSDQLRELANSTVQEHKTAIEAEKEIRARIRRERLKALQRIKQGKRAFTKYDSLSAGRSSHQFPAILRVAETGIFGRQAPPFLHPREYF